MQDTCAQAGIAGGCARAASGHEAAAPPSTDMKSRRLMLDLPLPESVYCTFNLPFAIWTLRPTIDSIPKELDEAATVDGASTWLVIREVIFPLARPGIAVTLILTWVFAWNEFLLALVMVSSDARRTVPLGLAFFQGQHSSDVALLAAGAVLVALPVVIVYLVFQRRFIEGMLTGAVKE